MRDRGNSGRGQVRRGRRVAGLHKEEPTQTSARIARSLERVAMSLGCARVRRLRCYGSVERGARVPLAGMRPCNRPIACRHGPYACLRGQIPRGAPVPRSDTPCWGFSRNCRATPSSHPHLPQRASRNLIRASLGPLRAAGADWSRSRRSWTGNRAGRAPGPRRKGRRTREAIMQADNASVNRVQTPRQPFRPAALHPRHRRGESSLPV